MSEAVTSKRDTSRVGYVGECIVAADLLLKGFDVHFAAASYPYDLIAIRNNEFYRIQVKACSKKAKNRNRRKTQGYIFSINGKTSNFDIFAFVAIDIRCVGYLHIDSYFATGKASFLPPNSEQHSKRKNKNLDEYTIEKAISKTTSW